MHQEKDHLTRNLFRKVEGIDPKKPWQPANRNECKVPNSTREIGKDKSEISFKIVQKLSYKLFRLVGRVFLSSFVKNFLR